MREGGQWSTSTAFPRVDTFTSALARYQHARTTALATDNPSDAILERWGGSVDRVVATRAATSTDLASKVRVMLVEGRGGDGCLIAVLEDLEAMPRAGAAAVPIGGDLAGLASMAEVQGLAPELLEGLAQQLTDAAIRIRARAGSGVGNA